MSNLYIQYFIHLFSFPSFLPATLLYIHSSIHVFIHASFYPSIFTVTIHSFLHSPTRQPTHILVHPPSHHPSVLWPMHLSSFPLLSSFLFNSVTFPVVSSLADPWCGPPCNYLTSASPHLFPIVPFPWLRCWGPLWDAQWKQARERKIYLCFSLHDLSLPRKSLGKETLELKCWDFRVASPSAYLVCSDLNPWGGWSGVLTVQPRDLVRGLPLLPELAVQRVVGQDCEGGFWISNMAF